MHRGSPLSEIACRRPISDEAEALCTLIERILVTSFPAFPREAIADYLEPWTPDGVTSRLEQGNDVLIAAFAGNEVIGLVSGTAPEGGVGTVIWLLVDAPWRGHRTGRSLYQAACDAYRALGAHKVKLTAPSEQAKRFYERCGMSVEGIHPEHWYKMTFTSLGSAL